jgi:lipoprotein-anchoring transpeptidase ErfK/SrfK
MAKKILIVILIILGAVAIAAASFEVVFADQLPYGVYIDGKSYPKANKAEVAKLVTESINRYNETGITFSLADKNKIIKLSDMGITFNTNTTTEEAFDVFSRDLPLAGSVSLAYAIITGKNKISLSTTYDENTFKTYLQQTLHPFFDSRATNATISFDKQPVSINDPQNGTIIDDKLIRQEIDQAISKHLTAVTIPMQVDIADVNSQDLQTAAADADSLLNRKITLIGGTKKVTPSRDEMITWLSIVSESSNLRTKPDATKLKDYLTKISATVNKKAQNQVVDPSANVLSAGISGITLNIDKSVQAMMDGLIGDKKSDSITLVTSTTDYKSVTYDPQEGGTAGLAEGKYVEINLSKQKMYLYEGQTFVNSFGVSTGKWSTPTPTGTFQIYNKISKAYSKPYDLYMPYWSAITADGQYGIHGLPFKGSWVEGASHIGTPVSHGCVRLGPGNDSNVYDWAVIGTPVFIHK